MRICAATPGAGSSAGENEYQPENTGYAGRVPYFLAVLPLGEEVRSGGGHRGGHGLIGANGAGKTTTLHAISGLLRFASGSITLDGTDLQSVPANSIIRMGLAHVPEGRHVFAQMTVEENLKMGAYTISDARLVAENMERVYGHFPRLKERRRQLAEDDRVRKAYLGA